MRPDSQVRYSRVPGVWGSDSRPPGRELRPRDVQAGDRLGKERPELRVLTTPRCRQNNHLAVKWPSCRLDIRTVRCEGNDWEFVEYVSDERANRHDYTIPEGP
jgi:hypothetical protein